MCVAQASNAQYMSSFSFAERWFLPSRKGSAEKCCKIILSVSSTFAHQKPSMMSIKQQILVRETSLTVYASKKSGSNAKTLSHVEPQ